MNLYRSISKLNAFILKVIDKTIEIYVRNATLLRDHHFYSGLIDSGSTVVDLGAHLGEFSYQISNGFGCKCYSVEASPALYSQIQRTHLIKPFNYVITNSNEPVTLYISKNPESNSLNKLSTDRWGTEKSEFVDGITFETFLDNNKIVSIDLLKVDIEGAEVQLFDSVSDDTIRQIKQITIEFHDFIKEFNCANEVKEIKKRLKSLGFFSLVFSRPYNFDILFINKAICNISNLEWLKLYILEYLILRFRSIVYYFEVRRYLRS